MNIDKIINFLKTDIWGLIILGVVSSILAGIIYDFLKSKYKSTHQTIKKKRFTKRLVEIATSFGQGSRAVYAQNGTTFQQAVLVGDYIIKTIILVGWILFYLLMSIATLVILGDILSWVPVIIFSVIITIRYKKLKQHLEYFDQTFKIVFGEKYFKDELQGKKEYWDKLFKDKNKNNET